MAADWVGVVYGVGDQMIHAIIVPDDDRELNDRAWIHSGELMTRVTRSFYAQHTDHISLARYIGLSG